MYAIEPANMPWNLSTKKMFYWRVAYYFVTFKQKKFRNQIRSKIVINVWYHSNCSTVTTTSQLFSSSAARTKQKYQPNAIVGNTNSTCFTVLITFLRFKAIRVRTHCFKINYCARSLDAIFLHGVLIVSEISTTAISLKVITQKLVKKYCHTCTLANA